MKNTMFKKVRGLVALVLMMCMVLSTFTGCKKDDSTLFSIVEEASNFENYTFDESGVITIDGEEITFKATGVVNGANWSMSLNAGYAAYNVELGEVLKYVDNSLYLNIEAIADAVSAFIPGVNAASMLQDVYGIPVGWYELPMPEGYLDLNNEMYKEQNALSVTMLQDVLNGIEIKKDKDVFTVEINSVDQFVSLVENMATFMEAHKAELIEMSVGTDEMYDGVVSIVDTYAESAINAISKVNEEQGLGATEADIQEIKDELQVEMDSLKEELTSMKEEMTTEMEASFDEAIATFREAAEELKGYEMGENTISFVISNSLTGKSGSKEYTADIDLTVAAEETEVTMVIDSIIKQETVEVTLPENAIKLDDWMYAIISLAVKNGMAESEEPAVY